MVPMNTIWDADCRHQILERFEKLTPDARPAWGQMNAAQMLAHLADPLKTAMGTKPATLKRSAFSNPIVRTLIIYYLPWPKDAPTAPEFVHAHEEHFGENLAAFRNTLQQFVASGEVQRKIRTQRSAGYRGRLGDDWCIATWIITCGSSVSNSLMIRYRKIRQRSGYLEFVGFHSESRIRLVRTTKASHCAARAL
jgi:hypothetical protein